MAGFIDLHVDIIKGGVEKYNLVNPIFKLGPVERHSEYLVFEGISVDDTGKQYYMDVHIAYRQACLNVIAYLKKFGLTGEQAYLLLSRAPVEGISGIVDIPNACCTLAIPTEIFDQNIFPVEQRIVMLLVVNCERLSGIMKSTVKFLGCVASTASQTTPCYFFGWC